MVITEVHILYVDLIQGNRYIHIPYMVTVFETVIRDFVVSGTVSKPTTSGGGTSTIRVGAGGGVILRHF